MLNYKSLIVMKWVFKGWRIITKLRGWNQEVALQNIWESHWRWILVSASMMGIGATQRDITTMVDAVIAVIFTAMSIVFVND